MKKMRTRHYLTLSLAAILATTLIRSPLIAAPPKGDAELAALDASLPGDLINDPRALIDLSQNAGGAKTKIIKSDKIPGGGAARQVEVTSVPADPWRISLGMGITKSVARGEVVTIGFYARALPGKDGKASGKINARVQQNVSPWSGFLDHSFDIGPDWQWYEKAGVATIPLQAGAASVSLFLGTKEQTVEVGQVIVVKGANAIQTPSSAIKPVLVMPPALEKIAGTLINRPEGGPWNFYGSGGSQQRIDDKTIFMGKATRVTVTEAANEPWKLAASIPISGPIKQGDRLLVAISAKTMSSAAPDGKARVNLRFQAMKPPYTGFADNVIAPGPNWQLLQLRTTATMDIVDGEAVFNLMFAGQKQVVDIGPVYIFKLTE